MRFQGLQGLFQGRDSCSNEDAESARQLQTTIRAIAIAIAIIIAGLQGNSELLLYLL